MKNFNTEKLNIIKDSAISFFVKGVIERCNNRDVLDIVHDLELLTNLYRLKLDEEIINHRGI